MNPFLRAALPVLLLDQATKLWMVARLVPDRPVELIPGFLFLSLAYNRGAAFSLLDGWTAALALFSAAACLCLAVLVRREWVQGNRRLAWVYGGLLGGVAGNLVDRLRLGGVIDFLDVRLGTYHWPTFNLADSAICLCVAGLAAFLVFEPGHDRSAGAPPPAVPPAPSGDAGNPRTRETPRRVSDFI